MTDHRLRMRDAARRRLMFALAAGGASLAGCGSGGSSGDTASSGTPAASTTTPSPPASDTASGQAAGTSGGAQVSALEPPPAGIFGGGQGRIVFIEGGDRPQTVKSYDLATRTVQTLVRPRSATFFSLRSGVSRAADGSFAVIGGDVTVVGSKRTIFQYRADGTLLRTYDTTLSATRGIALSPDGQSVAFVQKIQVNIGSATFRDALRVSVVDLASGAERTGDLLGTGDPPLDKSIYNPRVAWAPDGRLWVLSELGLHRIDPATVRATPVHSPNLEDPVTLAASPDGLLLYFEQRRGSPFGPATWSLDLATGALRQRSLRSSSGNQFAPSLSPDGRWLLMQQAELTLAGTAVLSALQVSAIALTDDAVDSQRLGIVLRDQNGKAFTASGAMVWY